LLPFLISRLPHIPAESWPERFDFGGVYVNGREALTDLPLPYPCKIEYYEPKFAISDAASIFPPFSAENILYHDEHIAVAYKPPRLSSMPAKEQRHFSLKRYLDNYFGRPVHMPSRLDVSAQGLVVVSTSPLAHAGLQRAFELRTVSKTYRFATHTVEPFGERTVSLNIANDPRHPVLRRASLTEGQSAETLLRFSHSALSGEHAVSVITAKPITGRTHQIRVHAASQQMPIVGDNFYDGLTAPYLHLVSYALEITHPITKLPLSLELPEKLTPAWVRTPR
jgi:23S rRNA-/tRNA-specific pseudouridylate synthase